MNKKCSICGNDYFEKSNDSEPLVKGGCCNKCYGDAIRALILTYKYENPVFKLVKSDAERLRVAATMDGFKIAEETFCQSTGHKFHIYQKDNKTQILVNVKNKKS